MYELWIDADSNFLYFTTDKTTIDEAWDDFCSALYSVGCVTDNFGYAEIELRKYHDGDYDVVERKVR